MTTINTSKYINIFVCEKCDFKCSKKGDYNRHILSRKHKISTDGNNDAIKKTSYVCEICNKEYKDRTGLWRHKKKCSNVQSDIVSNTNTNSNIDMVKMTEMFKYMMTQNQDFISDIFDKVMANR